MRDQPQDLRHAGQALHQQSHIPSPCVSPGVAWDSLCSPGWLWTSHHPASGSWDYRPLQQPPASQYILGSEFWSSSFKHKRFPHRCSRGGAVWVGAVSSSQATFVTPLWLFKAVSLPSNPRSCHFTEALGGRRQGKVTATSPTLLCP